MQTTDDNSKDLSTGNATLKSPVSYGSTGRKVRVQSRAYFKVRGEEIGKRIDSKIHSCSLFKVGVSIWQSVKRIQGRRATLHS